MAVVNVAVIAAAAATTMLRKVEVSATSIARMGMVFGAGRPLQGETPRGAGGAAIFDPPSSSSSSYRALPLSAFILRPISLTLPRSSSPSPSPSPSPPRFCIPPAVPADNDRHPFATFAFRSLLTPDASCSAQIWSYRAPKSTSRRGGSGIEVGRGGDRDVYGHKDGNDNEEEEDEEEEALEDDEVYDDDHDEDEDDDDDDVTLHFDGDYSDDDDGVEEGGRVRSTSSSLDHNDGQDDNDEYYQGGEGDDAKDDDYDDYDDNDDDEEDDDDHDGDDGRSSTASSPHTSPAELRLNALLESIDRALDAVTRKEASLRSELVKAQDYERISAKANLIVANLYRLPPGTERVVVEDWTRALVDDSISNDVNVGKAAGEGGGEGNGPTMVELILDTKKYASAKEEADALFASARKMKRGSAAVSELLVDVNNSKRILEEGRMDAEAARGKAKDKGPADDCNKDDDIDVDEGMVILIQERMERHAGKTGFRMLDPEDIGQERGRKGRVGSSKEVNRPRQKGTKKDASRRRRYQPTFRVLSSPTGKTVLVGRNRRDNEALCFRVAKKNDVWMHARGCPGAHVLIQYRRGGNSQIPITDDDLQFGANLAAFYSDARTERRAEVTVAEPKHILKPRGAPPGAVKLRMEGRTVIGRPDDVPPYLKEMREESGMAWDEMGYRALGGRARNKKRMEDASRRSAAKRREEKRRRNKRRTRREGMRSTSEDGDA